MKSTGNRAVLGVVLSFAMGVAFLAATLGSLAAAQPVAAQPLAKTRDAVHFQERTAPRPATASETLSMVKLVTTNSGDNAIVFNGQPITYTIVITNNSSSHTATSISVLDQLPAGTLDEIKCLDACQQIFSAQQVPEPLGGTVLVTVTTQLSWTVTSLAPQASTQLRFTARVVGQTDGTVFKNRAFATYSLNGSPGATSTPDAITTVHAQIQQSGQTSLSSAPTWFSSDLGGTLSQDWGDFNGDGQLDLVLGSSLGVSVYVNQNGQLKPYWNNFSNPPRRAYGVRWADVNHDGKLEIVSVGDSINASAVTSGTNYIYGPVPGGFTQVGSFVSDYQMVRVAVGDFTGHKNIDIIASTNTLNAACPVRLFTNDGQGNFTASPNCVSQSATAALGPGDFDNNGTLDLAVGVFPNEIEVLRNNGSGNFSALPPVVVDGNVPFLPYDFAWGDFDSNGLLDLAAAFPLQKEARVYRNLGNGTFDNALPPFHTTKFLSPLSVAWGDFNGDGALDFAVADDIPKVYLNQQGQFDQSSPLAASSVAGQIWSLRAEQVAGSGDLNLSLTDRDSPSLLFDSFGAHLATSLTPMALSSQPANSLALGDADGNGSIDMLLGAASFPAQGTSINYNSNGSLSTQLQLQSGPGPQSVAFGDVDGDGNLDIAVGTAVEAQLYLSGQTVPAWTASAPNGPNHVVAFCDVNSDGRLDLLVGANGSGVAVYLNQGGTLAASPSFVTPDTGNIKAIACADFQRSHYPGFAVAFDNQPVLVYGNNRDGTFTQVFSTTPSLHTTSLAWGDFNRDGYSDLAVGNYNQGTQIYENHSGTLQKTPIWTSPTQWATTALAWGDWNNDGQIDLAIGNDNEQAQVYGNLDSTPGQPRLFWLWTSADKFQTTSIAWGDFSGDGHLDLALSQKGACCNGYYRNGSILPSHLSSNYVPTLSLPNNPAYLYVKRPGITSDGYGNSAAEILGGPAMPTVTVVYTLYDPNGARSNLITNAPGNTIANTIFQYSLDGGSNWLTATAAAGWAGPVTTTSRLGQSATFPWDVIKDKAISDDARFRVRVVPYVPVGPVESASAVAVSPPFIVRGTTCAWPQNPSMTISQDPISPTVPAGFFGSILAGTGAMTYTWDFGDNNSIQGQVTQHTYLQSGTYTVTLTVSGQPCPQNRDVVVSQQVLVGTGLSPKAYNIYLPVLQGGVSAEDSAAVHHNLTFTQTDPGGDSATSWLGSTKVNASPLPHVDQERALAMALAGLPPTVETLTTSPVGINNEPSLNEDGTRIAFWSTANPTGNNPDGSIEVFMIMTDTGGLTITQITSSTGSILGGFNLSPSIDAAGDRVTFFSDRDLVGQNTDNSFQIFLYDVLSRTLTQVTHNTKGFNILPAISSDGNNIVFASDRDFVGSNPDGNTEIFRAHIQPGGGISFTQVTNTTGGVNDTPRVNANGTRVVFVSDHNLDQVHPDNILNLREVYLADIGPTGQVTYTQITRTSSGTTGEPSIDDDGQRLAFVSDRSPTTTTDLNPAKVNEIFYADVDAAHNLSITRISNDNTEVGNEQPSISQDGTRIGFLSPMPTTPANGMARVFDTLLGKELTATVGPALNPALSGDGTVLAFALNRQLYTFSNRLVRLTLSKSAPAGPIFPGDPLSYTVVLRNAGPSRATNIVLTDTLGSIPGATPGWGFVGDVLDSTASGNCATSTGTPIICSIANLPARTTVTLTVGITPTTYGTLTNTVTVTTDTQLRTIVPDVTVTVTVVPRPVAAVSLTLASPATGTAYENETFLASVMPVTASVPLTYSWQATNQADRTFTSTVFTDSEIYSWNPGGVQLVTVTVSNAALNVVTATNTITIFNPSPVLSSTSPITAIAGSSQIPLALTGTGFVANSSVLWNGAALSTTFVTSGSLSAIVPSSDLTPTGTYTVSVLNPSPGGGLSNALNFLVEYPNPILTSIQPIVATRGGLTFTLNVAGSQIISGASLFFGNQPALPTTFISSTALAATIPFSYLLSAGTVNITVTNPSPSVGPSNALPFTIVNPTLGLTVSPAAIDVGQSSTLTATISDPQAADRTITLTTSNSSIASGLPATITLLAQTTSVATTVNGGLAGFAAITGTLPANIGGASGSTQLTVKNLVPSITLTNPLTTTAGGLTFTLTLTGSNFVNGATLYWDGQPLNLFSNGSVVTASVPASFIFGPELAVITTTNPAPNEGASTPFTFLVVSPTISLNPSSQNLPFSTVGTLTATVSAAQAGNRTISVSTSDAGLVSVPIQFTLPAGSLSKTFTFTTSSATAGTAVITASLPGAQGGQSDTASVTVFNPGPTVGSVSPNPITVTVPVTLDILGTGFVNSTTVNFDGTILTGTQILSSTELLAPVPVGLYPIAGSYVVTLTNPAPGGGSFTTTVTAVNPVPQITSLVPVSVTAGGTGGCCLFVVGSGFISGTSTVQWNGSPRTTAFFSSTVVGAVVTRADLASPDIISITVFNSPPSGGLSNSAPFTIATSTPRITTFTPTTVTVGDPAFTMVVTGTGFVTSPDPTKDSVILINSIQITPTFFVTGTVLTATVDPSVSLQTAGTYTVAVLNPDSPGPDKLAVAPIVLHVINPVPTISDMNPKVATVGDPDTVLTVTGSNFVQGVSTVLWNNSGLSTGFVDSTHLTATINNTLLNSAGFFTVTVSNTPPGGGTAGPPLTFTVDNKAPTLFSLNPMTKTLAAFNGNFALTVNGSDFASGATILWSNGAITTPLGTNFNSSSQVAGVVTNTLYDASAGYYTVTVSNASLLGGSILSNNALTFTVDNPKPIITSISPTTTIAGTGSVGIVITGVIGSFRSGATTLWDGSIRTHIYTSTTLLEMITNDSDIAAVGVHTISVQNPDPSNGVSASQNFTITAPTLTLVPPGAQTLTIPASGVLTATLSVVPVDDEVITLTSSNPNFVSVPPTITIQGSTTQTPFNLSTATSISGTATITAQLPPALGGGTSNVVTIHVKDAAITGLTAANSGPTLLGNSTALTATKTGGTNVSYSWNPGDGSGPTAPVITPTLTYTYPTSAGNVYTAVVTATNSIGTNVVATTVVTINNPTPVISNVSPSTLISNTATPITITGTSFIAGASVQIQLHSGGPITTYTPSTLSATQITVTILATGVPSPGSYDIWVLNPNPAFANKSNVFPFTVQ